MTGPRPFPPSAAAAADLPPETGHLPFTGTCQGQPDGHGPLVSAPGSVAAAGSHARSRRPILSVEPHRRGQRATEVSMSGWDSYRAVYGAELRAAAREIDDHGWAVVAAAPTALLLVTGTR